MNLQEWRDRRKAKHALQESADRAKAPWEIQIRNDANVVLSTKAAPGIVFVIKREAWDEIRRRMLPQDMAFNLYYTMCALHNIFQGVKLVLDHGVYVQEQGRVLWKMDVAGHSLMVVGESPTSLRVEDTTEGTLYQINNPKAWGVMVQRWYYNNYKGRGNANA